jgi:hypothetical protein
VVWDKEDRSSEMSNAETDASVSTDSVVLRTRDLTKGASNRNSSTNLRVLVFPPSAINKRKSITIGGKTRYSKLYALSRTYALYTLHSTLYTASFN